MRHGLKWKAKRGLRKWPTNDKMLISNIFLKSRNGRFAQGLSSVSKRCLLLRFVQYIPLVLRNKYCTINYMLKIPNQVLLCLDHGQQKRQIKGLT